MGKIEIDHTGSGSGVTISSDGTDLLLDGTTVGGGGGFGSDLILNDKTSNYTVVAADAGKVITHSNNDITISFDAASTLGAGFHVWIKNRAGASDTTKIEPTETLDGRGFDYLYTGESTHVYTDGVKWYSVDRTTMFAGNTATDYYARPTAIGRGSIAAGLQANAYGAYSAAYGYTATAGGSNSLALGNTAIASSSSSIALGLSRAGGVYSTAVNINSNSTSYGATGANSVAMGKLAKATGTNAVAIGNESVSAGNKSLAGPSSYASGYVSFAAANNSSTGAYGAKSDYTVALGFQATATMAYSIAIGSQATASGNYAAAFGRQAVATSDSVAMAKSYASGTDSFAAAIANNSSSYGATGANSIAIGQQAKATVNNSVAIGGVGNTAGSYATAIGGTYNSATGQSSFATGEYTSAAQRGKIAFGVSQSGVLQQGGILVLRSYSTDATPAVLYAGGQSVGANQVVLPNNSAYAFHGTIVARQQASQGTACAAWKIEGLIRREGSAGTTVLVNSTTTVLDNTPSWGMALSADTTNGGLKIEVTGAAATTIRCVATIHTSEVTN